jgi:lipoprotein-anchoring transpeptidase ErfK/SrfK
MSLHSWGEADRLPRHSFAARRRATPLERPMTDAPTWLRHTATVLPACRRAWRRRPVLPVLSRARRGRPRRRAGWLVTALIAAFVCAGCASTTGSTSARRPAAVLPQAAAAEAPQPAAAELPGAGLVRLGPGPQAAWAKREAVLYAKPAKSRALGRYPAHTPWGGPSVYAVLQAWRDDAGEVWLQVLVPRRPNGMTAWVQGRNFLVARLRYSILVDLSERRLSVLRGDRVVRAFTVAVGAPGTPTPVGNFFITVKLRPPAISQVYGQWALGLSGYSNVLDQFGTGDGQIALHGTNGTWALGRAVSNGCVRLANGDVSEVARLAPPGTPVRVQH